MLARRPFGVRTVPAVARLAGSNTAATGRALRRLSRRGVVTRRSDLVAADRARQVATWTIDWRSPAWHEIASQVGAVQLPPPTVGAQRVARRLPVRLAHLFWSNEVGDLNPAVHGHLVASRILRADDCQALGWLARSLRPAHIIAATEGRGLDRRRAALGRLLAQAHLGGSVTAPAR